MPAAMIIAAAALMLAPLAADAQSFRCVGKDGKKYYASTVPPQCAGQPVEELNRQGLVVRRIDPKGAEEERRAKQAEEKKKREELNAQRESNRRNAALLATYTSTKDIDDARKRALAANQKAAEQAEARIAQIRQRQAGYEKELASHKGKQPPAKLMEDIQAAESELKSQEHSLETRKKEADSINARFDEEKRRYAELTGRP